MKKIKGIMIALLLTVSMSIAPVVYAFGAESETVETEAMTEAMLETETADETEEGEETSFENDTEIEANEKQPEDETVVIAETENELNVEMEISETETTDVEKTTEDQIIEEEQVKIAASAATTYPYEIPMLYPAEVSVEYKYNSNYTSYTIRPYVSFYWYQLDLADLGRASFRIYRKTETGSWVKVKDIINTGYYDTYYDYNVKWGQTFYYTVRSISADGRNYLSDYDRKGIKVKVYLETPPLISLTSLNDGIKFSWTGIDYIEKYFIYRKTGSGAWTKIAEVTPNLDLDYERLSYTDKTAKAGIKYAYTVRGVTKDGKTFTTAYDTKGLSTVFVKPPVLKGAANVFGGVKVTWSAAAGAENYRVFRKSGSGNWTAIGNTTGTSYIDKTVKSGTKYSYTVRAVSKDGKTLHSAYDTTGKSVTYIAAPALKSVQAINGGVQVKWAKPAGAVKYRVFRKSGSSGWTKVGDTTSTTYTDKAVTSGTRYAYTVRCLSSDAKIFTSANDSKGLSSTYVSTPVLSGAVNIADGVKITWKKPAGAVNYRVYRKNGNGSWAKVGDTTATSYVDSTVKSGTTYTYTVRCLSADGKEFHSYFDTTGKSVTVK